MTFLPIVERELREGARRKTTRNIRLIVAVVALLLSLFQLALMPLMRMTSASGGAGFGLMTGYGLVICLLAGIFVTADCLSEEKREGTLGLLFLTDLRGYDVVLGKPTSQFLQLGYALLAIIPSAALPLLIGGVTGGEVWRVSLALLNLLFFSLAAGLLASSLSRQATQAMGLTALILIAACLGWPMVISLADFAATGRLDDWYLWLSPTQAYSQAVDASHQLAPHRFWTALGMSNLFGWGLIAWASWRLPRSWQDRPIVAATGVRAKAAQLFQTNARVQRRRELLDTAPLRWLIGESVSARVICWVTAIVWVLGMFAIAFFNAGQILFVALVYGRIVLFPMKLIFAFQSCRFFAETRRTGAFELLLAAPLSTRELVAAQWAMLRRIFLAPGVTVLGSTVLAGVYLAVKNSGQEMVLPAVGFGGLLAVFVLLESVLDFFAMGYLGMWLALTMRKPHLAVGATILFVLILPTFMCGVGIVVDIVLIAIFGAKLRSNFRQTILEQRAATTAPTV